jgi:ABC-type uncharacterized transport system involved in gliding motility auxiliary subunit
MATTEQKRKAAAQTGVYLVVLIAILVVANVLASKAYSRLDVTKTDRYTLSQGSGRLIRSLKTPVQVDAYVKTGLPHLDAFVRDLTDLLKQYEADGGGKFKYTLIEPNTDALREQAKEAGLQEIPFVDPDQQNQDQASIAQGYLGLVFKYGSEKGVMPLSPGQNEGLEFWMTNKIREIRDKADEIKYRVGVITGKDELKLSDQNLVPKQGRQGGGAPTLQGIMEQAFPFYKIEEVDLKDGAEAIDKGLVGLIITQPRKDYSDKELRRIDEFLMQGGKSLAVYASAVTLKPQDPAMNATISTHNLDKLLSGYGIQMNKDAVLDHGAQFRIGVPTQGGVAWLRHPGIAHVVNNPGLDDEEKALDTSFPSFFRMDEFLFPMPSSLKILREKQPADVKLDVLARSTPQSSVEKGETVDMKMREQWKPKQPQEQRILAASAQGKLKSAFAGQPGDDVTAPERAATDSRVLVIASGLFLTNPFAYAGNGPDLGGQFAMFGNVGGDELLQAIATPYAQKHLTNTILSFKNTLDWLAGDNDLIAVSAKLISDPNLTYSSISKPKFKDGDDEAELKRKDEEYRSARKSLQDKVQWTLTLGLPLLFGAFGVFRWRRRETARDRYKL